MSRKQGKGEFEMLCFLTSRLYTLSPC